MKIRLDASRTLEQFEEARTAYAFLVSAWADADPGVQPIVDEARGGIARLTSVLRE